MKKIYVTMVAMLCGVAVSAQNPFSVEDISGVADGQTVTYLVVKYNGDAATTLAGATVDFPDEIFIKTGEQKETEVPGKPGEKVMVDQVKPIIALVWNEDDEEYVQDISYPKAKSNSKVLALFEVSPVMLDRYSLVVTSTTNDVTFKTSTDELFKVGLVFDEAVPAGEYEIVFKPYWGIGDDTHEEEAIVAKLTITGGTGINGINAADSKAPVYNLAGQRVNKAQKGVFIQNGKKVAVK